MAFITKSGKIIADGELESYLKRNATNMQVAKWIDDHEEDYRIFGQDIEAHKIAFAYFGYDRTREMVLDFVSSMGEGPDDFAPFGLKYVDDRAMKASAERKQTAKTAAVKRATAKRKASAKRRY